MKSTVKIVDKEQEMEFPKLMESDGMIVLFESSKEGVVLSCGESDWNIGDYHKFWDAGVFKDFKGTVTLEN